MQTREKFEETFTVASFEANFTGRLTIHSLFDRFQDLAGRHADFLEVGFEKLRESGVAWMLSRIKVKIEALPAWGETVTLRTWPKGVDRLFALRDFRLANAAGENLALATTCWLLVDLDKGRPRRIESLNVDLNFPGADQAIRELPDKIVGPQKLDQIYEKQILLSELDMNEHVNNAHYVRWILDCFDAAQLRSTGVRSIQLNYLEQVLYGDRIVISKGALDRHAKINYVEGTSVRNGKKVFQAVVEWT
jgi:acyl-ACP thioesterase